MLSVDSPVVLVGLPGLLLVVAVYFTRPGWRRLAGALIGWRLTRRYGRRGLLALLLLMGVYGPLRDELARRDELRA